MKPIHQEHFEAWLFSQPDERTWDYCNPTECLICDFLKEQCGYVMPVVVPYSYGEGHNTPKTDYPKWLHQFMSMEARLTWCIEGTTFQRFITAALAKAGYTKIFNNDNKEENAPLLPHLSQTSRA